MAKNHDIFGIREKRDKTAVANGVAERAAKDAAKEMETESPGEPVGPRLRATKTLSKMVKKVPMFALEKAMRKDAEAVEPPKEMPNNQVEPPKKKEEE